MHLNNLSSLLKKAKDPTNRINHACPKTHQNGAHKSKETKQKSSAKEDEELTLFTYNQHTYLEQSFTSPPLKI